MNDNGSDPNAGPVSRGPSSPEKGTQALRLGVERPRITRLSRKVLAGGTALALLLVSGAVLWALRSNQPHNPSPDELYSTDHRTTADGLTTLPRDYAGIARDAPQIGQPLPGGLAHPIVSTEGQSGCRTAACQPGNRGSADQQGICVDDGAGCATAVEGNANQRGVIFGRNLCAERAGSQTTVRQRSGRPADDRA